MDIAFIRYSGDLNLTFNSERNAAGMQLLNTPGPATQAMQLHCLHEKEQRPMHLPLRIPATSSDTMCFRWT